jgi:hypothetical protein
MANYTKSYNFRNGLQVDDDSFVINANGLVGIGTSVPSEYLVSVYGDIRTTGIVTASSTVTALGGFTSGTGNPIKISVSGSVLTFTVTGVGSTSLTLY